LRKVEKKLADLEQRSI